MISRSPSPPSSRQQQRIYLHNHNYNHYGAHRGWVIDHHESQIRPTRSINRGFGQTNNRGSSPTPTISSATLSTLLQMMAAFLIAGFGNVGAGLILDYVKEWPVFLHVNELFILVPSLLGLKGNLEMTMASRLSTQANLGHMDNVHELIKMAKGNLALVQCQATVVSFVVAIFASFVKSMSEAQPQPLESPTGPVLAGGQVGSNADLALASTIQAAITSVGAAALAMANSSEPTNGLEAGPLQQPNATSTLMNLLLQQQQRQQQQQQFGSPVTNQVGPSGQDFLSSAEMLAAGILAGGGSGVGAGGEASLVVRETTRQVNGFDWNNALILCASSLLTANIACFVLGTVMILVIVGSHRVQIDPDNIASPVAASLGDMTTAALLAVIAHSIYSYSENQRLPYIALIITLLFLGMLPIWICVAKSNPYTSSVITKGWTPIVIAVFISSCGGFILEHGKSRFQRLPVFQPVINGVGGNLVAVQASRLSTSLHRIGKPGELPSNFKLLTGPFELFMLKKNDINMTTARLLLLMSVPAHLLYFYVIHFIEGENTIPITVIFLSLYMLFAVLQVAILLYLAQNLVSFLWRCSIDPDNYSTPLLTATGDLLGCAFLLIVFVIAYQFNDPYALTTV